MKLKTCPECGGKMERGKTKFVKEAKGVLIVIEDISADICVDCGAEYLPSEVDKYVEGVIEEIIANKVKPRMEEVYRIAVRMREEEKMRFLEKRNGNQYW